MCARFRRAMQAARTRWLTRSSREEAQCKHAMAFLCAFTNPCFQTSVNCVCLNTYRYTPRTGNILPSVNDTVVLLDGAPCLIDWPASNDTQLVCETARRPKVFQYVVGSEAFIPGKGQVTIKAEHFVYIDRWSSPLTWRDGIVPRDGDSVHLVRGRNILLDISPPQLFLIVLEGSLVFENEPTANLRLQYSYFFVRQGTLVIGTEDNPYQGQATLTAHGTRRSLLELPIYGSKMLAVRGGDISMFGQPRLSWSSIDATVAAGASIIQLAEDHDWQVGDHIAIAPSSFSFLEAEDRVITATSGRVLTLDRPLLYRHYSGYQAVEGSESAAHSGTGQSGRVGVRMAAEVGLLTRNIVFEGDEDSWRDEFGQHMLFHSPNRKFRARIEYVEFRNAGQAGLIGRYPIHFHVEGPSADSWVKGCSVHHTFNRAVVLHETDNVLVKDCVAFDNVGHAFFVEDGTERYNTFEHNLGMLTRPTGGQLAHDVFPSTFWLANPNNNYIDNVAAGSNTHGFWIAPPKHPRARSSNDVDCPFQAPLGQFSGNVAHSNGRNGLWAFPQHYARQDECGHNDPAINPYILSTIEDFVAYKNMETGLSIVNTGSYDLVRVAVLDNADGGVEVGDTNGPYSRVLINDSWIVARSGNAPEENVAASGRGIIGLYAPKSDGLIVDRVTFQGFGATGANDKCMYTCHECFTRCDREAGAFTYTTSNIKFLDSPNRVLWGTPVINDIIQDLDGTWAGKLPLRSALFVSSFCVAVGVCRNAVRLTFCAFHPQAPASPLGSRPTRCGTCCSRIVVATAQWAATGLLPTPALWQTTTSIASCWPSRRPTRCGGLPGT